MTDGNKTRKGAVGRTRVAVVVLFALVFLVPVLGVGVGSVAAQPDCGSITYAQYTDSLGVQTVQQLQCMGQNPTADYTLRSDIDASVTEDWYDGAGFDPVGTFRGTFDGNGHTVRGLTIDRPEVSEVGLFASASSEAVMENVRLERVDVTGNEFVGGLAGRTRGEVRNSSVSGVVVGERGVGGLVGFNVGGVVTRTFSTADVTANEKNGGGLVGRNTGEVSLSYTDANVRGDTVLGGLVGYSLADIRDTYSTSTVNANIATVGGIVGRNRGDGFLSKSYSAGELDATSEANGVAGTNSGTVVTSYFDSESVRGRSSPEDSIVGIRLTTRQMTGENAELRMEGLDFGETWIITDSNSYPVLSWQTSDEPIHQQGVSDGDVGEIDDGDGEDTDSETGDGNETDDGTDGEADDGTADEGDTDGEETDDETDDETDGTEGMPGFSFVAGIVALLCGALLLSRRTGSD